MQVFLYFVLEKYIFLIVVFEQSFCYSVACVSWLSKLLSCLLCFVSVVCVYVGAICCEFVRGL